MSEDGELLAERRGHVGVVTTLIPRAGFDPLHTIAFVCGPEIMMRFAALLTISTLLAAAPAAASTAAAEPSSESLESSAMVMSSVNEATRARAGVRTTTRSACTRPWVTTARRTARRRAGWSGSARSS